MLEGENSVGQILRAVVKTSEIGKGSFDDKVGIITVLTVFKLSNLLQCQVYVHVRTHTHTHST